MHLPRFSAPPARIDMQQYLDFCLFSISQFSLYHTFAIGEGFVRGRKNKVEGVATIYEIPGLFAEWQASGFFMAHAIHP
jgi:hypothetical protein